MAKFVASRWQCYLALLLIISGCATALKVIDYHELYGPAEPRQRILPVQAYRHELAQGKVSFADEIKPVLDSRCVVCHSCYDAPCQLKLNSMEGLDRGASRQKVYDGKRLEAARPTRLFIDAGDTFSWRQRGFYPVLNEREQSVTANLDNSLLVKMLQLKRLYPLPKRDKLDDVFDLELNRELQCPDIDEFAGFQHDHPLWGMPYAMPALTLDEEYTLLKWVEQGAHTGVKPPLSQQAQAAIRLWENFFNGASLKQKLVARYIYEHLFLGHLHFQGHPDQEFYRLVRSKTPPGTAIEEISTVRPYDDPGIEPFYYRLRPVTATIVDKTHIVYTLSREKMARWQALFFQPDYSVSRLPPYKTELAANPFKTFQDIPRTSRYKFLLDDAAFFVSGFIKGPVCRGQVALNVIRDRFWVVFLDPELDAKLQITREFDQFLAAQDLSLPAGDGDQIGLLKWRQFDRLASDYLQKKEKFANWIFNHYGGVRLSAIWDGGGHNRNAALTVFRHFDSATVVQGFIGKTPLTAWVVDYPIFERLHYLLVAGFNVYGSLAHQLATRSYMDYLRMGAENNFLRFMPRAQRKTIYDQWYRGITGKMATVFHKPFYSAGYETGIDYQTDAPKTEFFARLRTRFGRAAGAVDYLNDCGKSACIRPGANDVQRQADQQMAKIAQLHGAFLDILPEISFVRVKTDPGEDDLVYTLLLNKALKNTAIMFLEDMRRLPDEDRVTVVSGFVGSYPNFFFVVDKSQLAEFVHDIQYARTEQERENFYKIYGVRRTRNDIWTQMDWFNVQHKRYRGLSAGIFDISRYRNL